MWLHTSVAIININSSYHTHDCIIIIVWFWPCVVDLSVSGPSLPDLRARAPFRNNKKQKKQEVLSSSPKRYDPGTLAHWSENGEMVKVYQKQNSTEGPVSNHQPIELALFDYSYWVHSCTNAVHRHVGMSATYLTFKCFGFKRSGWVVKYPLS